MRNFANRLKTIYDTMNANKYPHPWTQDQALTDRLLKLVDEEDWDLFGIADGGPFNRRRP
ncbi:MAG: hypothetical protein K6E93_08815 [Bacteroidales bacterium]|nr:hypothetical protein [Bacteroidales bacterium]